MNLEENNSSRVIPATEPARVGKVKNFTGIDDPYEPPPRPGLHLDSAARPAGENAELVPAYLVERGFLLPYPAQEWRP